MRFVAGPDGEVVPDICGKLPGRGLWITPQRDIIDKACRSNLFAKAAKAPLKASRDLAQLVEDLLVSRCLELLGLANRAGQAVAGFEKVKAWLHGGQAGILIQAGDSGADGRQKLLALARKAAPDAVMVEGFSAAELGRALGHDARVHVAVAPGGVAQQLVVELGRLLSLGGRVRRSVLD
jgi:predicted RNA-binding protein YlxR (DUF448 family)